jgi:hypothetical protein
VNEITSRAGFRPSGFGKAFLMTTTATSVTPEPTLDDALVATAAETAAHDQADAAAADRAHAAAVRARRESRQMAVAWVSLVAGLVVSLGVFSSIAWQNSVAANGTGATAPAVSTAP